MFGALVDLSFRASCSLAACHGRLRRITPDSCLSLRTRGPVLGRGPIGFLRQSHGHTVSGSSTVFDVVIVGGGIIGLATARELTLRHGSLLVAVLEKEQTLAYHQTGHNSGVIHTGIYYTPGSLKAKLCVEGCELIYQYCDQNNIPYRKCGKIIVAVDEDELPRLEALYERGLKNQVKGLSMIEAEEIKHIEPLCKGLKAIHSPETGIVDYGCVARSFAQSFKEMGGEVHTGAEVIDFSLDKDIVAVHVKGGNSFLGRYVLTCAGLHSDQLASKSGCSREPRIVPFRGEYLLMKKEKEHLIRGNIYPVPDPQFPFLGVHFTPRIDGGIWLGPNAVLGFAREGYKFWNINLKELLDSLTYRGLRKLARKHWHYGLGEFYRSLLLRAQVHQLQKYVPDVTIDDVVRGPTGVRAQALDIDGNLVDDFVFDSGTGQIGSHLLHVRNAPSPGATSSLAIAKLIVDKFEERFGIGN